MKQLRCPNYIHIVGDIVGFKKLELQAAFFL